VKDPGEIWKKGGWGGWGGGGGACHGPPDTCLRGRGWVGGGFWQIALVWMAVLAAGVKTVKMGADTVLAVADVVPALCLKTSRSARPPHA
jgi:hypothetical protein